MDYASRHFLAKVVIAISFLVLLALFSSSSVFYNVYGSVTAPGILQQFVWGPIGLPFLFRVVPQDLHAYDFSISSDGKQLTYLCTVSNVKGLCIQKLGILGKVEQVLSENNSPLDFSEAVVTAWGKNDRFVYFFTKDPTPESESWRLYEFDLQKNVARLVSQDTFFLPKYYSSGRLEYRFDTNTLIFRDTEKKIISLDIASGSWETIVERYSNVALSHSQTKLVYVSFHHSGLVVKDLHTGQEKLVLNNDQIACSGVTSIMGFAWSPDDRHIIFFDECGERDHNIPYVVNVETGQVGQLFYRRNGVLYSDPVWVP